MDPFRFWRAAPSRTAFWNYHANMGPCRGRLIVWSLMLWYSSGVRRETRTDGGENRSCDTAGSLSQIRQSYKAWESLAELCPDRHPLGDGPDMLHVVYVPHLSKLDGLKASLASVATVAPLPRQVMAHILVRKDWEQDFKTHLRIRPECSATLTSSGVLLRVQSFDPSALSDSHALDFPGALLRGARGRCPQTPEHKVERYLHLFLTPVVSLYLPTQTIAKDDIAQFTSRAFRARNTHGFELPLYNNGSNGTCDRAFAIDFASFSFPPKQVRSWYDLGIVQQGRSNVIEYVKDTQHSLAAYKNAFDSLLKPFDPYPRPSALVERAQGMSSSLYSALDEKIVADKCAVLVDAWSGDCVPGRTFGCSNDSKSMFTKDGCSGVFLVSGQVTVCGETPAISECKRGHMPEPQKKCGLMIVIAFLTKNIDWQRGIRVAQQFSKIRNFYSSVLRLGLNATVLHDGLPTDVINTYECNNVRFQKVNLEDFDAHLSSNDVRFLATEQVLEKHSDWKYTFLVDGFDVSVGKNPCLDLEKEDVKGKLYVGREIGALRNGPASWFLVSRFREMGGKWKKWYEDAVLAKDTPMLNCGITGGDRTIYLEFLGKCRELLKEYLKFHAAAASPSAGWQTHADMSMTNYVAFTSFQDRYLTGEPVNSVFKAMQFNRTDVWFIHK
eukprot:TRINITY_DN7289_c0_g2_i1.p1 TRINITY_DN7289_c0_g2~~TRINITY_DN7289_c0_g2_i1.p1  ORF type:complete len:668 (-),score=47.42 TRINITY_DN7289_c0_g2_i1:118-2121(-)